LHLSSFQVLNAGRICILDVELQGVKSIHAIQPPLNAQYILIRPSSISELEKRLRGRGTETEETLSKRLARAREDIAFSETEEGQKLFTKIIINDDLNTGYKEQLSISYQSDMVPISINFDTGASPCAPLVWDPVKAPDICFSSSHFHKQHSRCEKAVSRTSLAEALCSWPCESISRGREGPPHSRPYQGIWELLMMSLIRGRNGCSNQSGLDWNIQLDNIKSTSDDSTLNLSYRVHGFYYAWYDAPQKLSNQNSLNNNDNNWSHWNHQRLKHWNAKVAIGYSTEPHYPPYLLASSFYPKLGPYSSKDLNIIHIHMEMIRFAGIGVLVVSWYPKGMSDDNGKPVDDIIFPLLNIANKYGIKVCY
ncbi:unnamed protein product, partial [Schistosoma curassoni]|uniref:Guanylate kinase-like domain-containing protein n=1 Tax=Schistosoma curassoni TaxID=6186 RepID=A0A183KCZ0_9TREM